MEIQSTMAGNSTGMYPLPAGQVQPRDDNRHGYYCVHGRMLTS